MIYNSFNNKLTEYLPKNAEKILDLGCGTGLMGEFLKIKYKAHVTGITYSSEEAELARDKMDDVICADLNTFDFSGMAGFDLVVCSHVLEHLTQSKLVIENLRKIISPGGILIVALPNILHWKQRWEFICGRFQYTEFGLMDSTHVRFYDWITAQQLLTQSGWKIDRAIGDGNFPLPFVRNMMSEAISSWIDRKALEYAPGLFSGQFIFRVKQ